MKTILISQVISPYSPISDCENYNKFLTSPTLDDLKYYTSEISPLGIIKFNLNKSQEYDGIESLHDLLMVDTGSTFELTMVTPSRFNSNKEYSRYQQYHNNVKVEGGGYTVVSIANDGGDPCAPPWALSPFIGSNRNVPTTPAFAENNLGTVLTSENGLESELIIVQNLLYECNYHLTWRVTYSNNGGKISWVDAQTGGVLKTIDSGMGLMATTPTYGPRNLDNFSGGGATSMMVSADGRVRTYDFGEGCPTSPLDEDEWENDLTPTTTQSSWSNEAAAEVYQAHFVVTEVLPVFDALGIDFGMVNVGSCTESDARSLRDTDGNAFIYFGEQDGISYALRDVAAHELSHAYLYNFLEYSNLGNRTLHEGIADMFGAYGESVAQGFVDWIAGDDEDVIANIAGRDMEFPGNGFDCFDDSLGEDEAQPQYNRSMPLSHWFYLISEGAETAIGLENAMLLVVESLNLLGPDSDYEEMVEAVMTVVNKEYGLCSPAANRVGAAWNQICMESELICHFNISGLQEVCEESNSLALSIINSTPGATYTWYFPGQWTVAGSGSQNHIDGTSLLVSGFPTYAWYPQYFTITVAIQPSGETQSINITLNDCDGDDPDCEDIFPPNDYEAVIKTEESDPDPMNTVSSEIALLKVYDIMGRLIYEGSPLNYNIQATPYDGVLILSYFNKYGELVDTEKRVIIK